MTSITDQEAERIRGEYRRRSAEIPADYYSLAKPVNLFFQQGQERALRWGLERSQLLPLTNRRVLDVGCGMGDWLAIFESFGAQRSNLVGIDLGAERAEIARTRFPEADVQIGSAAQLPWPDASFDVIFQRTVFTSILDSEMKRVVASEMLRVLRPGGAILWIDFAFNNPRNTNVRGIKLAEIGTLFPTCQIVSRRITLMPPLARQIVPRCWLVAEILQSLKVLNTHRFCIIRRATDVVPANS